MSEKKQTPQTGLVVQGAHKKSAEEMALIMHESKALVPTIVRALRELNEDKKHQLMLEVFRKVDSKQTELEVYEKAYGEVVVTRKVVGQKEGKEVVKYETTKSRNIAHLVKTLGRDEVAEIIRLLLVNVNNSFNIKNGLNIYQVNETADDIIELYGNRLFMDELIYIFKKAKTTAELFQSLDGSTICRWIEAHYKMKEHCQMRKDAEYKSKGFDLPQLPKGMVKGAVEKMQEKFVNNFIDISQVPKPTSGKKKKKKE